MDIPEHTCDDVPEDCVAIYCEDLSDAPERKLWTIAYMRNATEADLEENSIIENVGDEIWRIEAKIRACPYCGTLLSEANVVDITADPLNSHDYFRLLDQEAWSMRVR